MADYKRFLLISGFLLICRLAIAVVPVTVEGVLHSTKNGNIIARVPVIMEIKSAETGEYVLVIGNQRGINALNGSKKALWIFKQQLRIADLRSVTNTVAETGNISIFMPFCNSKNVTFDIPRFREIEGQSFFPFSTTASAGEKIKMSLCMYVVDKNRRRTVVEEETQMILELELPAINIAAPNIAAESRTNETKTTLAVDNELEKYDQTTPEVLALQATQRADSILRVKTSDLDNFIDLKNKELDAFFPLANNMTKGEKEAAESLEALVNKLNENVKIKKDGNIALISDNDMLGEKFAFFNVRYNELIKTIGDLKLPPPKPNWTMYFGIAAGVMLGGMFFMQIWNSLKAKRQQKKLTQQAQDALKGNLMQNVNKDILPKV